jgi:uncharacterized membrane-anchored protein YjiN (DUF445 family)
MIAEKVIQGILSTLGEMRDPAHRWRAELRQTVEQLIADLAADPKMSTLADSFRGRAAVESARNRTGQDAVGGNRAQPQ